MTIGVALVLALLQGSDEDKAECKTYLELFSGAYHNISEATRIIAVENLAVHKCPLAIAALAPLLTSDTDKVRIAAAKALSDMDHPKSREALAAALVPNESSRGVFEAIVKALRVQDWESGAEPLNALLGKYREKALLDLLGIVIDALGGLGSQTSIDPLLRLLEHIESEGRAARTGKVQTPGDAKLAALEAPIKKALQAITGGNEPSSKKWKEWWGANRERLAASAVIVYRCRGTGRHWEQKAGEIPLCPGHEKPERDAQVVATHLHPPK
jgi:HEAT repeat protein